MGILHPWLLSRDQPYLFWSQVPINQILARDPGSLFFPPRISCCQCEQDCASPFQMWKWKTHFKFMQHWSWTNMLYFTRGMAEAPHIHAKSSGQTQHLRRARIFEFFFGPCTNSIHWKNLPRDSFIVCFQPRSQHIQGCSWATPRWPYLNASIEVRSCTPKTFATERSLQGPKQVCCQLSLLHMLLIFLIYAHWHVQGWMSSELVRTIVLACGCVSACIFTVNLCLYKLHMYVCKTVRMSVCLNVCNVM